MLVQDIYYVTDNNVILRELEIYQLGGKMMENSIPQTIVIKEKSYKLKKVYKNYALYIDLKNGIKECFNFQQLGLIKEKIKPSRKQYNNGMVAL